MRFSQCHRKKWSQKGDLDLGDIDVTDFSVEIAIKGFIIIIILSLDKFTELFGNQLELLNQKAFLFSADHEYGDWANCFLIAR